MRTRLLLLLQIALAAFGFALSLYLMLNHVEIEHGVKAEPSLCSLNARFDCDAVAASDYSSFIGIPIDTWGAAFYAIIAWLCAAALLLTSVRRFLLFQILLLSGAGLLIDLALAFILFFEIETICLVCVGTYAINIALLVLAILSARKEKASISAFSGLFRRSTIGSPEEGRSIFALINAAALFVALCAIALPFLLRLSFFLDDSTKEIAKRAEAFWQQAPLPELAPPSEALVYGKPDAPLQIVEFSDFECPFCRKAENELKLFWPYVKNRAAVYFMHFPLSTDCHDALPHNLHPMACKAAMSALCASRSKNFWEVKTALFEQQKDIFKSDDPTAALQTFGQTYGLSNEQSRACWENSDILARIKKDIAVGKALHIQGTPAFYINGRKIAGKRSLSLFRAIIDNAPRSN